MKNIYLFILLISANAAAQPTIAHFSFWKPIPGQEQNFEFGYKRHLEWHKDKGDKWSWYGWYFISGKRIGEFFDATFDHNWSDFDNPVKPFGDKVDNAKNTEPYADYLAGMKMMKLSQYCIEDSNSMKKKLMRFITITVTDRRKVGDIFERLKDDYKEIGIRSLYVFKPVDGSQLNKFIIFIGADDWQEFGKTDNFLEKIVSIEYKLDIKATGNIVSETLLYRDDMSLFPNQR